MLNVFKQNNNSEYKEILKKAFPKDLHSDLEVVVNMLPFKDNEVKLDNGKTIYVETLISESEESLILGNDKVTIPYRLYFDDPNPELEKTLTLKQKDILNCIYLRHHNGYVRERRLNLISDNYEKWVVPFIIQLISEYVYELLPFIDKKVNENTLKYYVEFINNNPEYWQKIESRMISYWNEYYRSEYPNINEYLGWKIINRIKEEKES